MILLKSLLWAPWICSFPGLSLLLMYFSQNFPTKSKPQDIFIHQPSCPCVWGPSLGTTSPVLPGMHLCPRSGLLLDFGTSEKPQNRKGKTQRATEMRLGGYEVSQSLLRTCRLQSQLRSEVKLRGWELGHLAHLIEPYSPSFSPSSPHQHVILLTYWLLERWQSSNMPSHTQVTNYSTKFRRGQWGEHCEVHQLKRAFFLTETPDGSGIPEFVVAVVVTFQ